MSICCETHVDIRDCVDGIVTRLNVASWIDSHLRARVFFSKESVRAGPGATQPPFYWVSGLKWLEREADCTPLSNAGVGNEWSYIFRPLYTF